MKSIFLLYLPGHAGNFLTRLFSLGPETIPHLGKKLLKKSINDKELVIDRLNYYSFTNVKKRFNTWQDFHGSFTDFHDYSELELLNSVLPNKFSHVTYAIHPHEFIEFIEFYNIIQNIDMEVYHIELDLNLYGGWVQKATKELKFMLRYNEPQQFNNIVFDYNSKEISLTRMLQSTEDFVNEYVRVCKLMKLSPQIDQAVELYKDWHSVRLPDANIPLEIIDTKKVNSLEIISRAYYDDHSIELFKQLLSTVTSNYEAYYICSEPAQPFIKFIKELTPTYPNVIIGIKDLLDLYQDFNWWTKTGQGGVVMLQELAFDNPSTNFIIVTSLENLESELTHVPNIQIVPWGGDFVNQRDQYLTIDPVLDKDFTSTTTFISLNRNPRTHRLMLLGYLFGKKLDQYGDISYLGQESRRERLPGSDLLEHIPWQFNEDGTHDIIKETILNGYKNVYNNKSLAKDDFKIYPNSDIDNFSNFNNRLRPRYRHSFVEIITETTFSAPSYLLTEKFLNSVFACNFPILLSGVGAVDHLREIGFDMFDDIIDHTYSNISNPVDRITLSVDSNQHLLSDNEYTKACWKNCRERFISNLEVAKNIYTWYNNRAINMFSKLHWK